MEWSNLKLSPVNISGRGVKTSTLLNGKERLDTVFLEPTQCLFAPSTFDKDPDATRQGIPFAITQEISEFFTSLDIWAKKYIEDESERLTGKELSAEQVDFAYKSCIKDTPKGSLLKLKINMPNSARPCKFWDSDGKETDWPIDWNTEFKMRIRISHLYIMGAGAKAEFGFVCIAEDLLPQKTIRASPF